MTHLDVLLVEPYYGGSHRDWADGFRDHSRHRVRLVTHPDRLWKWRMRGGALTLAESIVDHVRQHGRPDVVLVSDMVDLGDLRWLSRESLGAAPVALYLHENQLTHPIGPRQQPDEGLALRNWMSMVAADLVIINTDTHRQDLHRALDVLLRRPPELRHHHRLAAVMDATIVLPVGIRLVDVETVRRPIDPLLGPTVLWNQRWDPEKQPRVVLQMLADLAADGVPFRLVVVGENVRLDPDEFETARRILGDRMDLRGFVPERADYVDQLEAADVVISAATHETFGISLVEATVAGAVPLLPNRLSYPEVIPTSFHAGCLYRAGGLEGAARRVLGDLESARRSTEGLAAAMRRFDWRAVAPRYDETLERLVRQHQRRTGAT